MEEKITGWVVKADGLHAYMGECPYKIDSDWNIALSEWS